MMKLNIYCEIYSYILGGVRDIYVSSITNLSEQCNIAMTK